MEDLISVFDMLNVTKPPLVFTIWSHDMKLSLFLFSAIKNEKKQA